MKAQRRVDLHSNAGNGPATFLEGDEIPAEYAWNYRRDSGGNEAPEADLVALEVPEDASTVSAVTEWVQAAEDEETLQARAQAAYDAEHLRDSPRKGVLEVVNALLEES